ncbi:MAG: DUF177 domain-containing protein [bacterium]|nr:DUF177 domain-containing protein [bacterium]
MKLNLDTLPFGRSALEVEETFHVEDEEGGGDGLSVRGELAVDNVDSRVLVAGVLAVSCPAVCDRCLEAFTMAYEAGVDIQIIRAKPGAPDEESPDTWILYQARGEVDLDEPLREAALLDLPIKRVCREDCLGFCPTCGADRNLKDCDCPREPADPRWDGLDS